MEVIEKFDIVLEKDRVLRQLGCRMESPLYEELTEEFYKWEPIVYKKIKPIALISKNKITEQKDREERFFAEEALYILLSLGKKMNELIEEFFAKDRYLLGLLVNTMADEYIFSMDKYLEKPIKEKCEGWKLGIKDRYEVSNDLPFSWQKTIWKQTNAMEYGIKINESYMLDPVKSMGYILTLTKDVKMFRMGHECSKCNYCTRFIHENEKLAERAFHRLTIGD